MPKFDQATSEVYDGAQGRKMVFRGFMLPSQVGVDG